MIIFEKLSDHFKKCIQQIFRNIAYKIKTFVLSKYRYWLHLTQERTHSFRDSRGGLPFMQNTSSRRGGKNNVWGGRQRKE